MTESNFPTRTIEQAAEQLCAADSVLICIHQNPDGDAVGSGFALAQILSAMGKTARVICADEIPHRLQFLLRAQDDCTYTPGMEEHYSLLCAVDTASVSQLGGLGHLAEKIALSIDHHAVNEPYSPHCTLPVSAAGEAIYQLYTLLCHSGEITPNGDICRLMYTAIVSDTGSFKYSNTTRDTLLAAADLLGEITACTDGGDDAAMLCHRLFECRTLSELYAQRVGIDALRIVHGGKIGVVQITREMLDRDNLSDTDVGNIVGLPRTVDGVLIALSLKQSADDPTIWRVSARASCDVDVSAVCASFGGGGHRRAAGCTITAPDAESAFSTAVFAFGDALDAWEAAQ